MLIALGLFTTLAVAWVPEVVSAWQRGFLGSAQEPWLARRDKNPYLPQLGVQTPEEVQYEKPDVWVGHAQIATLSEVYVLLTAPSTDPGFRGIPPRYDISDLPAWVVWPRAENPWGIDTSQDLWMLTMGAGWPMRCVRGHVIAITTGLQTMEKTERWDFKLFGKRIVLPVTLIWAGLIVNTAFYTACFAIPTFGIAWVRRTRRRRKGLCVGCGYPNPTIAKACPECGQSE